MPITILSPHSGDPVKIRDQDVGRAVKDNDGKLFYVLQDAEGGYYAALTRAGGQKDIDRYRHMAGRRGFTNAVEARDKPAPVYQRSASPRQVGIPWAKWIAVLILLGGAIGGVWYANKQGWVKVPGLSNAAAPTPKPASAP